MKTVKRLRPLLFAAALLSVCTTQAAPESPMIRTGSANVSLGSSTVINQSTPTLAIDWVSFDVSATESVRFNQPSASSVALNRVTSGSPSSIFGRIDANGKIILVNSAGILFGKTAQVNTGAFVASTLELDETTLGSDRLRFSGAGAKVENAGALNGQEFVAIVAPSIDNSGSIRGSSVALAAGAEVIISTAGGLFDVQVPVGAVTAAIENKGGAVATQGVAYLTARGVSAATSSLSNPGRVEATGLVERDGRIYLESEGALTTVGTVKATRATDGGDIEIKGGFVALGGTISADGAKGGAVKVESKGMLSLADQVTAKGVQTSGGRITYHSLGQTIENSTGRSDVSGRIDGGRLSLDAEQGVISSGSYLAVGLMGKGGIIDLTGYGARLLSATLDASGGTQGGLIRVGGAFQGGKNVGIRGDSGVLRDGYLLRWGDLPSISSATRVLINDTSSLVVTSTRGPAGTVVVWSEAQTTMAGSILASGLSRGGFVELSSADELRHADLSKVRGAFSLLLDPKNITVGTAVQASGWSYAAIIGAGYSWNSGLDVNDSIFSEGSSFNTAGETLSGISLALSADATRLALGLPYDNGYNGTSTSSGAVRLFSFTDGNFGGCMLESTIGRGYTGGKNVALSVSQASTNYRFGYSVALSSDAKTLAVGVPGDLGSGVPQGSYGAVRLFKFSDGNFSSVSQQFVIGKGYSGAASLDPGAYLETDEFGTSVALALNGRLLAVGAPGDDGAGNGIAGMGAVHLFSFNDDTFGGASHEAVVGVAYSSHPSFLLKGKNLDITGWGASDVFGQSVSLSEDGRMLAIGAPGDDSPWDYSSSYYDSGAAYLFSFGGDKFTSGVWQGVLGLGYGWGKSVSINAAANNRFGSSLSFSRDGEVLGVGSPGAGGGKVSLFRFSDAQFTSAGQVIELTSAGGAVDISAIAETYNSNSDNFGSAIALSLDGTRMVVGAPGDDGAGNGQSGWGVGAAHFIRFGSASFSSGKWLGSIGSNYASFKQLKAGTIDYADGFGGALALSADAKYLAIGCSGDDGLSNSVSGAGSVRLVRFSDGQFGGGELIGTIGAGYVGASSLDLSNVLGIDERLGRSVALNYAGTSLAIGASDKIYLIKFDGGPLMAPRHIGTIGVGATGSNSIDTSTIQIPWSGLGESVALNGAGNLLVAGTPNTYDVQWNSYYSRYDIAFGADGTQDVGSVQMFTFSDSNFSSPSHIGTIGRGYASIGGKRDMNASVGRWYDLGKYDYYGDRFGTSVALNEDGTVLAVGGPGRPATPFSTVDLGHNGSVKIIKFASPGFYSGQEIKDFSDSNSNTGINTHVDLDLGDNFGAKVALDRTGTRLAVLAPGYAGINNLFPGEGALYMVSLLSDGVTVSSFRLHSNSDWFTSLSRMNLKMVNFTINADWNRLIVSGSDSTINGFSFGQLSSGEALSAPQGLFVAGNPSPLAGDDRFGGSVSLNADGTLLAVGAPYTAFQGDPHGAVRLFTFQDGSFAGGALAGVIGKGYAGGRNIVVASLDAGDGFGSSVSLNAAGDRLAVGAPGDDGANVGSNNSDYGNVSLFTFQNGSFAGGAVAGVIGKGYTGVRNVDIAGYGGQINLDVGDFFGTAVSLNASGDRLAVGAPGDDGSSGLGDGGSAFGNIRLFTFSDTSFNGGNLYGVIGKGYREGVNTKQVIVNGLDSNDKFGSAVSLNAAGNWIAVGAPGDDGATYSGDGGYDYGSVHHFEFAGTSFTDGGVNPVTGFIGKGYAGARRVDVANLDVGDGFGSSVSLNATGDRIAVGAPGDDGATFVGSGSYDYGSVRLFTFLAGSFTGGALYGTLGKGYVGGQNVDVASLDTVDSFGSAVSLNSTGDRLAVGSPGDDGATYLGGGSYGYGSVLLFGFGGLPPVNATFNSISGTDSLINSAQVAAALASGTAITLQANNDITIASPIDAGVGSAGELLLYAGRNVRFDADVRIGSRDLGVVANASAADGVIGAHRDAGQGGFTMAPGVSVVAGDFAVLVRGVDASSSNPNSSPGSVTLGSVTATRFGVGISGSGLSVRTITQNVGSSIAISGDVTLANQLGDISLAESGNGAWSGTASLLASGSLSVRSSSGLTIDNLSAASFDVRASGVVNVSGPVSLGASGYGFMSSTSATFSDDITLVAAADMRVNASGSITLAGITPSLAAGSQLRFYGCDDVVVSAPIAAASGSVGELRLTAGRDIKLNANVSLGGADLYARANAKVSDGIYGSYRPVGQGDFTMGSGTLLNADSVTVIVRGVDTDVTNVNTSPGGITLAGVTAGSLTLAVEGTGFTDRVISQFVGSNVSVSGVASVSNSLGNVYLSSTGNGAWAGTTNLSAYGTLSLNVASALSLGGLSAGSFTVISAGAMNVGGATSLGMSGTGLLRAPGINVAGSVSVGMFSTLNVVSSSEMRLTGASASISTGGSLRLWSTNLAIDTTNRMGYNYKLYGATYGVSNVTSTGIGWIYSLSSPYALSAPAAMSSSAGMSLQMANYFRPVTPAFLGAYPMVSPAAPRSFESFFNSGELILPILSAPYQWDGVHDEEASSWLLDTKRDSASTTPAPKR
jgi:filamentous hemagglutinin family protein